VTIIAVVTIVYPPWFHNLSPEITIAKAGKPIVRLAQA